MAVEMKNPMKTYLRDEFATVQRIKELESLNADLLAALQSIIEWQDCPVTRPEAKKLLIRNAARAAIAKANL